MKNPRSILYTFDPIARTIDFSANAGFDVRNLFGVAHPLLGRLIYSPANPAIGAAAIQGAKLSLRFDTSALGPNDLLIPMYEDGLAPAPADYATNAKLEQIRAALAAQIDFEETVWVDPATTTFYARRVIEAEGTGGYSVVWTDAGGNAVTPPAGVEPAARTANRAVETAYYDATAAGTGYASGDVLARVLVLDIRTGAVAAAFWHNLTQGAVIAAPASGSFIEQTKAVVATSPQWPASLGQKTAAQSTSVVLSSDGPFATNFGAPGDAAATTDAGSFSFVALFKRALGYLGSLAGTVSGGTVQAAVRSNAPRVAASGSLSAVNAAVTLPLDGMSTAVVQVLGTWAGTIAWFGTVDGTNYVSMNMIPYGGTGAKTPSTTGNGVWEAACGGLVALQAVMTGYTSGSAAVALAATSGLKSVRVANPSADPLTVTGTVTASLQGGNATPVSTVALDGVVPAGAPFSLSAAGTLFSVDTTGSQSIALQLTGTWSATVAYEVSNDNATWSTAVGYTPANTGQGGPSGSDTGTILRIFPTTARYFRARVVSYTSGTVVASPVLRTTPVPPVALSLGSALPAGTNLLGRVGIDQTTPGTTNRVSIGTDGTVAVSNAFALDATLTARLGTLGQKAMAGSTPVVIASDQGAVPVSGAVTATLPDTRATASLNLTTTASPVTIAVPPGATTLMFGATGIAASGAAYTLAGSVDGTTFASSLTGYGRSGAGFYLNGFVQDLAAASVNVAGLAAVQFIVTTVGTGTLSIPYVFSVGGSNAGGPVQASGSTGGLSTVTRIASAAASVNATTSKTAAGRVYQVTGYNAATTVRWLKFYNKRSLPVPGTDTPYFQLALLPGAFSVTAQDIGYFFSAGIGFALTVGAADNDATALTAGDILNLNVWYQ